VWFCVVLTGSVWFCVVLTGSVWFRVLVFQVCGDSGVMVDYVRFLQTYGDGRASPGRAASTCSVRYAHDANAVNM